MCNRAIYLHTTHLYGVLKVWRRTVFRRCSEAGGPQAQGILWALKAYFRHVVIIRKFKYTVNKVHSAT